jgi:hypothetical protein
MQQQLSFRPLPEWGEGVVFGRLNLLSARRKKAPYYVSEAIELTDWFGMTLAPVGGEGRVRERGKRIMPTQFPYVD